MPDVQVLLQQPAALGTRPGAGNVIATHRHVPGSTLRGALAAVWIAEHGKPPRSGPLRDDFVSLFERGVRFGPLFASGSGVVPMSVRRCKYRSRPGCNMQYADQASDDSAPQRCPRCDGPMVPGRGEVEFLDTAGQRHGPVVRVTRTALTARETAAQGQLFTRTALFPTGPDNRPRPFTGRIIGGGAWLLGNRTIRLGSSRSTLGEAGYRAVAGSNTEPPATIGQQRQLIIRLLSPAILVDDYGRPAQRPDPRLLEQILGVAVTPDRAWTRRTVASGWHAASRLPKPEEHAMAIGSVWEYTLHDDPDPNALRALTDHGIGLRRAEGFGWIELGPWQPPAPPDNDQPEQARRTRAELLDQGLLGFADRALLKDLVDRVELLRRDPTHAADRDLLNKRRIRELPPPQYRAVEYALNLGPDELHDLCQRLKLRIQGV